MGSNVIVDVVIGLVVLYWLVATFSSFVVEVINSMFNVRGEALQIFVREMLVGVGDQVLMQVRRRMTWRWSEAPGPERPDVAGAQRSISLADLDITTHPLIRRLYKPAGDINKADTAPSYIPADLFTKALLDRLSQLYSSVLVVRDALLAAQTHLPQKYRDALAPQLDRGLAMIDSAQAAAEMVQKIGAFDADADREALKDALDNAISAATGPMRIALGVVASRVSKPEDWAAALSDTAKLRSEIAAELKTRLGSRALTMSDLRHIVETGKLPDSLTASLRPLLDAANHDIDAFRKAVDDWYSSVMDRASGWFKRRAQWILFVVALLVAVALNLDTIYIGRQLASDAQLREMAVQLGSRIAADPDAASSFGQQVALRSAFGDGKWAEQIRPGATVQEADPMALRVLALSSKHGAMVAPLLSQQAVALRVDSKAAWQSQAASMQKLAGTLCRARIMTTPARESDRAWAAQNKDDDLAKDQQRCKDEIALLTAAFDKGNLDAFGELWGSSQISWDTALSLSAWRVHQLAMQKHTQQDGEQAVSALSNSIRNALAGPNSNLSDLDAMRSRLPRVGSPVKAFDGWLEAHASGWAALESLLGWLLTGFMASLGAPLWFDLLNHLTSRRISGPKPDASPAAV